MGEPNTAENALVALAGLVDARTDRFAPDPRTVSLAVRRLVREHEALRSALARVCDEAERAAGGLRRVEAP